jgi:hypothetical protein
VETNHFTEQREELLQSIQKDEAEVRVAVHELTGAARKLDLSEHIKKFPLTWVMGALLVGAWIGSRGASVDAAGHRRT